MKIGQLKELIKDIDDDVEVFIRDRNKIAGNISELESVVEDTYGFFGESLPCIILDKE